MEVLFLLGMILGQHCGYTNLTQMRAVIDQYSNNFSMILSILTFPAWIGLFIWGFINLTWYITLGTFLICALVITPLVFKSDRLHLIYRYQKISESLLVIIGLIIWLI